MRWVAAPSSSSAPANPSLDSCLVLWPIGPALVEALGASFREVAYFPIQGPDADLDAPRPVADDYARADAIFAFALPAELKHPRQTPRLALFQCCSAGISHLQETAFYQALGPESQVVWANASGIQASTIGEHVLGTVLMLTHKVHYLYLEQQVKQRWVPHRELGGTFIRELKTLTVGIVGYGNIGRETARLFSTCGSTVLALTRSGRPEPFPSSSFSLPSTGDPSGTLPAAYYSTQQRSERLAFFARCDVVVNTLPDSAATRGCFGDDEFRAMKGDAIYVNVGRGSTTDHDVLVEALRAQPGEGEARDAVGTLRIGAASLDVVTPEPLPSSSPLYRLPNVILTPHSAALSAEYWHRAVLDVFALNVKRLRRGEQGVNVWRAPTTARGPA
ncbi:hypothetical protein JCM3775_004028 [Rhodotorula graminis]